MVIKVKNMKHIFDDYIYQYCLHDCLLNSIRTDYQKIMLRFDSGIYLLDNEGKETELTESCEMVLNLEFAGCNDFDAHIIITRQRKKKILDVTFSDLIRSVQKNAFEIENCFCSNFNNALLLKGYIGNWQYDIIISEIEEMQLVWN